MSRSLHYDRPALIHPGLVFGFSGLVALAAPFIRFKPNRIVAGKGLNLVELFSPVTGWAVVFVIICLCLALATPRLPRGLRLILAFSGVLLSIFILGIAADHLTPEGNDVVRVSPSFCFWLLFSAFSLAAADVLKRMQLSLRMRVIMCFLVTAIAVVILKSPLLDDTSIMVEYLSRQGIFFDACKQHGFLALGSLVVAFLFGFPLGITLYQVPMLRKGVLGFLTLFQTIPSLALFGIMIPIFSWVGANVPVIREMGISGIGRFPAFVALFVYSLLPVVSNTLVALSGVPPAVRDAARGIGMTSAQVLFSVLIPLSLPFILTTARIVLVQNIGLAVIAGLIGGGGFGSFVFQGLNQSAMDLILLGALPTITLALVCGAALDLLADALDHSERSSRSLS